MTIPTNVSNPFSRFGVISIENGLIKKKVVYSTLHKRLDFGLFLNDVGSNLSSSEQVSKLMKMFPYVLSSKLEQIEEPLGDGHKREWSEIEKILSDEIGRYYFKAHATNEYSVENILLYEEISNFKGMTLQNDFKIENQIEKAKEIYEMFLTPDSIMELNVTQSLTKEYKNRINELHLKFDDLNDLFDDLMEEIKFGVIVDTFRRFKKSRLYLEYKNSDVGEKVITYLI